VGREVTYAINVVLNGDTRSWDSELDKRVLLDGFDHALQTRNDGIDIALLTKVGRCGDLHAEATVDGKGTASS
jgi:hypothetical protein